MQIDKNVPIPKATQPSRGNIGRPMKYRALIEMDVGDSVYVEPFKDALRAITSVRNIKRWHPENAHYRFTGRCENDGMRIWRTA